MSRAPPLTPRRAQPSLHPMTFTPSPVPAPAPSSFAEWQAYEKQRRADELRWKKLDGDFRVARLHAIGGMVFGLAQIAAGVALVLLATLWATDRTGLFLGAAGLFGAALGGWRIYRAVARLPLVPSGDDSEPGGD